MSDLFENVKWTSGWKRLFGVMKSERNVKKEGKQVDTRHLKF